VLGSVDGLPFGRCVDLEFGGFLAALAKRTAAACEVYFKVISSLSTCHFIDITRPL
jgi:hypothetical protein